MKSATATKLSNGIKAAARNAMEREPHNVDPRARCFIAGLSGWMKSIDPELESVLWALLDEAGPSSPSSGPQ